MIIYILTLVEYDYFRFPEIVCVSTDKDLLIAKAKMYSEPLYEYQEIEDCPSDVSKKRKAHLWISKFNDLATSVS